MCKKSSLNKELNKGREWLVNYNTSKTQFISFDS